VRVHHGGVFDAFVVCVDGCWLAIDGLRRLDSGCIDIQHLPTVRLERLHFPLSVVVELQAARFLRDAALFGAGFRLLLD